MKSIQTVQIGDDIERILRRYDPERDLVQGGPVVTSTDAALITIIERLVICIEDLYDQIEEMK